MYKFISVWSSIIWYIGSVVLGKVEYFVWADRNRPIYVIFMILDESALLSLDQGFISDTNGNQITYYHLLQQLSVWNICKTRPCTSSQLSRK